ncbi:MAG: GGDEF domain-containing phosphodiesterase [Lachnospiraceae bacterium]|nr:GGDEF domain-containing phosphodiesterase [Lachnospiraceae bacterium]
MNRFLRWFGVKDRNDYVNHYFAWANFRSSIYMSVVIMILESWMLISLLQRWIAGDTTRSKTWFIEHLIWYLLFFGAALVMLLFALRYLKGKTKSPLPGKCVMVVFSTVSLYFGMSVSYSDYIKGEQILCFIMMVTFVFGLLNWRPYISIPVTSFVFWYFYHMMEQSPVVTMTYATQVNYFTMWICVMMLSLAVYSQRLSEATKDLKLEESSIQDELTGIPNMVYFRKKARNILLEEGVGDKVFLFLDLMNFKAFNEQMGFEMGNDCLRRMAKKVEEYFPEDLYARFSDDHFVVLATHNSIDERLQKLVDEVKHFYPNTGINLKVGGYRATDKDKDPSIACDHARYACSCVKKCFDKYYCEYDAKMDAAFHKRQYIITHVEEAVRKGYIQVYYQPIVWAKERTLCSVEALARWIDPEYGFLPPGEFIPALEEYRLIHYVDLEVLRQVCEQLKVGMEKSNHVVPVSVNFSQLDFELVDLPAEVERILSQYEIPRHMIHFEVTESALTEDSTLQQNLKAIRNTGVEVWLDDFGSGYSSLNVLKEYQLDVMKIDLVFLKHFHENEKSKKILQSIVTMADLIDLDTLTEGVEDEEQANFLESIGCKRLQGYLFGKPLPLKDFIEHCQTNHLVAE